MPPLVRAGLGVALLAILAVATARAPRSVRVGGTAPSGSSSAAQTALCPRGTLPDGNVCVPVPEPRERDARDAGAAAARARAEHDRIPRRPDRTADFGAYRLPVALLPKSAVSDPLFPAARGAAVRLVRLEHQEGEAELLYAGDVADVPGRAVVTRHAVRDASGLREYLAVFGNLERIEPGIARGATVRDGDRIGSVGDGGAHGSPALHYELRRLRSGVDAKKLESSEVTANARSVGCDARNVLPKK